MTNDQFSRRAYLIQARSKATRNHNLPRQQVAYPEPVVRAWGRGELLRQLTACEALSKQTVVQESDGRF